MTVERRETKLQANAEAIERWQRKLFRAAKELQKLTAQRKRLLGPSKGGPMVKGVIHVPAHNTPIKAGRREALLIAIAKARQWIDDLAHGRAASFAVIARREGKTERHIRLLAPLAFVSPRIVSALLDGTAPADLTLTKLARALPYCWAEQERRVGTSAPFHG